MLLSGGIEPPTYRLQSDCATDCAIRANYGRITPTQSGYLKFGEITQPY